ncbi:hypothetical protein PUN28_002509 [Cardiocondyla obscurior]|uniref:Uncharacterized protein n=1 Tax=Cardiocondyla obscurior TaxID=286306 RepID=A0AAW2GUK3_9HYME
MQTIYRYVYACNYRCGEQNQFIMLYIVVIIQKYNKDDTNNTVANHIKIILEGDYVLIFFQLIICTYTAKIVVGHLPVW